MTAPLDLAPDTVRTRRPRPGRGLIGFVLVPSLVIAVLMLALYLVVLPVLPVVGDYYFSQQAETYLAVRVPLLGHIALGAVALVTGAINVTTALRGRRLTRHAWVGRVYAVAVSGAAVFGGFLAFHAYAGTLPGGRFVVTSGFLALAIAWLATLAVAVHAMAVRRNLVAHRFWMIVNFSLTFAAVTIRLYNGALIPLGESTFDLVYPTLAWLSWVPNLVIGILLARRLASPRKASRLG